MASEPAEAPPGAAAGADGRSRGSRAPAHVAAGAAAGDAAAAVAAGAPPDVAGALSASAAGAASPYVRGAFLRVDEDESHEFKEIRSSHREAVAAMLFYLPKYVTVRPRRRIRAQRGVRQLGVITKIVLIVLLWGARRPVGGAQAFLNHRGGVLVFGVADSGAVTGIALGRDARDFLRREVDARMRQNIVCGVLWRAVVVAEAAAADTAALG